MIFPKVLHEVVVYALAQRSLHGIEVLHQLVLAHYHGEPLLEAHGGVVGEVGVGWHQRYDAIVIYLETGVWHLCLVLLHAVALVGKDESGLSML